jgi:serine/threonine protein phosphatase 1
MMKRYVIGDIHGCYKQLFELVHHINRHANGDPYRMIFVGDYVDRGPDSKGVIAFLSSLQKDGHVCLMGNHEDMLLSGDMEYAEQTLISFGTTEIPGYALEWMRSLPKFYEDETIIVAHGGAQPGVPLGEQPDQMLLWYRYSSGQKANMGKHFYHGHTPKKSVEMEVDRTNLDTACVFGNLLTAAIVGENGNPVGFIQVKA